MKRRSKPRYPSAITPPASPATRFAPSIDRAADTAVGVGSGPPSVTAYDARAPRPERPPDRARTHARDARTPWQTFGPLAPYLLRDGVTDLFVNGAGELWGDGGPRGLRRLEGWLADEQATRELAVRLIARGGRHIDEASPFVDVRLEGGVRVHAVLPPVSTRGTVLSIRIPSEHQPHLPDLVENGSIQPAQHEVLCRAILARTNMLITGAGGTGKTTLLAALLSHASVQERLVVIEDVAELDLCMAVNNYLLLHESKHNQAGVRHESHVALMLRCRLADKGAVRGVANACLVLFEGQHEKKPSWPAPSEFRLAEIPPVQP